MNAIPNALANVCDIIPYVPGKPIEYLKRELNLPKNLAIIKLASNENPLGIPPKAKSALRASISDIDRYPDGNAYKLKHAIVTKFKKYKINLDQLVIGNGSNDVLELAARAFLNHKQKAVFSQYSFAVYPLVCETCNAQKIEVKVKANFEQDLEKIALTATKKKVKLVFLANPNNPTGVYASLDRVYDFIKTIPANCVIILDQAYSEYLSEDQDKSLNWLAEFPNLIITRSFSKIYGLSGLRVGYAITHPQIANWMNRIRQPFNVNHLAMKAATAALSDKNFVLKSKKNNTQQLKYLDAELAKLSLPTIPSYANFISFKVKNANKIYLELLKSGIIIRPLASYQLKDWLRVTVGSPSQNKRFITTLSKILKNV